MARPPRFRETDVLTQAMLVFWQHGFTGTSVRHLEQATGLTASSLYNCFDSKEALFSRVLDHYIERVVQWRIDRYLGADDGMAGLRRFFDSTYDYISEQRPPMACLLANTALEKSATNLAFRAQLDRGLGLLEDAFADCLQRAVQAGQLRADCDCRRWARHLLLCLQGVLVDSTIHPDHGRLSELVDGVMAALPLQQH